MYMRIGGLTMGWKFTANGAVSLHDCEISEIIFGEDVILMFDDGFDVFGDCPQNGTYKNMRTGKAAVILENARFISGEISLDDEEKSRKITADELAELELDILDFREFPESVMLECDAFQDDKDAGFCEVEIACNGVRFCWNEFTEEAWF